MKISKYIEMKKAEHAAFMANRLPNKNEVCNVQLIEREIVKESAKAVAFEGSRFNQSANLVNCLIWFPKSKIERADNDYYENFNGGWFVPNWLIEAKEAEGFTFEVAQ